MTDGYARALALEAEYLRIAREIGPATAGALAERLSAIEYDRERLRALLTPLRLQTQALASSLAPARRVHS